MALSKPLPALIQDLRDLLTVDITAALRTLKEYLPKNGEKETRVLSLLARLNDAQTEKNKNTITPDDYQRRVDTIRAECFDLVAGLEAADFEETAQPGSAGKHGSVLYRVPQRMPMRKPTICIVRVAMDENSILEDIVLDKDVHVRPRVVVSKMMKAELLDPEGEVFTIRPLNDTLQQVLEEGYTEWLFTVTPKADGEHQLLVKVSMMELNSNLNQYVPREVSILETVTIVTEAAAPVDSEDTALKSTGERFALGPAKSGGLESQPLPASPAPPAMPLPSILSSDFPLHDYVMPSQIYSPGMDMSQGYAGSTSEPIIPQSTRDWWRLSQLDSAEGYAEYIVKYNNDASNLFLETAYFRKAERSDALKDLRAYQKKFPGGKFYDNVNEKIKIQETKAVEYIQSDPTAEKVTAYLRDFPQCEHLAEVTRAAALRPEVLREVQPAIEKALLGKARAATSSSQMEALLPTLESLGSEAALNKMQDIVAKKPEIKKEIMPQLRQTAERIHALRDAHLPPSDAAQ